jgi:formate dehydrogenase iron-sulfur subunit
MALPLLKRATEDGVTFVLTPKRSGSVAAPGAVLSTLAARMPLRAPEPGEQYRFHFDMGTCIGCKCCVVACNEQNGNPAAINWRRVGEIEGGWYPQTARSFLSMSCNHCLEPTCMTGCPVDAYTKDPTTGIVLHSADTCIGCRYCTWNCSYGVPQYNPERGVVGKCDMCHSRLGLGQAPACVSACPSGAIQVEIVKLDEWRAAAAVKIPAPGVPTADQSISSTRVTLPENLPPNSRSVDLVRLRIADPHWPLVIMTVFTQLSVGAFATIWLLQLLGASARLDAAALISLLVGALALAASTLHLGLGGVVASAYIYRVPSRPAWNTPFTLVQFLLTAATLGLLFSAAAGAGDSRWLAVAAATMASTELVILALRFFRFSASDAVELQATARLLATTLASRLVMRGVLLAAGAIALPLFTSHPAALWVAFALALGGEVLGRYLFFVSAVPTHMAAPYLGSEAA